jgi:serine/threonine-protein kinase RsbW
MNAVFPGRFESLAKISEFVRAQADAAGLNDESLYAIELAVDEACSNIIEHAYQGEDLGDIRISCLNDSQSFTIIIKDRGQAFDPKAIAKPDLETPIMDREPGGLGLFYIQSMMDQVDYSFQSDENVLTLVKQK